MSHPHTRMSFTDFDKTAPGIVQALRALGAAVDDSGLEKELTELIKLRISQINGCTFCAQFHLNLARDNRVSQTKLDQVAVWHDSEIFSPRERAALDWAEALTALERVPDQLHTELQRHFGPSEIVFLTGAVAAINAWNRIGVGLRFTPPPAKG